LRYEVSLPPEKQSVTVARHHVAEVLTRWQYTDIDAVALVVSELVTNAVVHARSPFVLSVEGRTGGVRISVRDGSSDGPGEPAEGLGMRIVDHHGQRWGWQPTPDGKVVWLDVLLH
jgi:anti-sigma regulatory factor (Ser/Thr protein kinase)